MTVEELVLLETLLQDFLGYDVVADLMLTDDVCKALTAVKRELRKNSGQLEFDFTKDVNS